MAAAGSSDAREGALNELYAADPSEFVAVRKRLAAGLRSAGEKDAAKELLAARRPTTAAWAINQLARREPDLVEAFLDRSRDLQTAQVGGSPGGREAIRDATRAHREALAAATDAALATLGSRATDAFRAQILATLHAASVDDAVGAQLHAGRMIREVTGSTGFPEGPGLTLVPDLEPEPATAPTAKRAPPKSKPATSKPSADEARQAKAEQAEQQRREREEAAAAELERQRTEAEAAWQVAQDEAAEAEAAADVAHERVTQLEQDLDDARREARAADEQATSARREAARLARAAMKLSSRPE